MRARSSRLMARFLGLSAARAMDKAAQRTARQRKGFWNARDMGRDYHPDADVLHEDRPRVSPTSAWRALRPAPDRERTPCSAVPAPARAIHARLSRDSRCVVW